MAVVEKTIDILGDGLLSAFIISRQVPEGYPVDFYDEVVKTIKNYALRGMSGVQSYNFPFVTTVGGWGLAGCPDLVSVTLPQCTTFTGNGGLRECTKLENVDLPLLKTVSEYAFTNCQKLRSINLPSLTSCSTGLFFGCNILETANLPKLQSMGNNTFYSCPAIRQIDLPSVKTIGSGQINGCRSLEVINIGPSITSINSQAFQSAPEGLVINLPVAEGAISGAPWGATSAVINYNTPYAGTVPIPES